MSTRRDPGLSLDILGQVSEEKHTTNHVEHAEHAEHTIDVLRQAEASISKPEVKLVLPLSQLVPTDFTGYYSAETYESKTDLQHGRRPKYTKRDLMDWEENDLRSLLIVHEIDPRWDGNLPIVLEQGYRLELLPLDANDAQIVELLAQSDIYKDQSVSHSDREAMARVALEIARDGTPESEPLSLPAWRHMIENYMLNLGCEVQTRRDYHELTTQLRRAKKASHGSSSLTVEERMAVWRSCQLSLYKRLHLNWSPDEF